jgi:hypothetical protein
MEVFKIQRSLFDSENQDKVMIYNKDRSVISILSLRKDKEKKFFDKIMQGREKIYVNATVNAENLLEIESAAVEPDW